MLAGGLTSSTSVSLPLLDPSKSRVMTKARRLPGDRKEEILNRIVAQEEPQLAGRSLGHFAIVISLHHR